MAKQMDSINPRVHPIATSKDVTHTKINKIVNEAKVVRMNDRLANKMISVAARSAMPAPLYAVLVIEPLVSNQYKHVLVAKP
mgnify:CR=1 FL=1